MAGDERSLIPVLSGPTGAGKSDLAFALARRLPITIIVADSRQIYRRFDVGTAVLTMILIKDLRADVKVDRDGERDRQQ